MSVTHELVNGILVLTAEGESTPAEIAAAFDAALADPDLRAPKGILIDTLQATVRGLTDEAIRAAAAHFSSAADRVGKRRALLVATALDETQGRIGAVYEDVWFRAELRMFRDRADAEAWLNSPAEGSPGELPPR
jgi:hypothetical protein